MNKPSRVKPENRFNEARYLLEKEDSRSNTRVCVHYTRKKRVNQSDLDPTIERTYIYSVRNKVQ